MVSVNGHINVLEIVDSNSWSVIARNFPNNNAYQDENASVHRVHIVSDFMETNNINTVTWPTQSPHLNINEHVN